MSTRSTLHHGGRHHLFVDYCEVGTVFLTMEGTAFEATPGRVTVAIPLDLWEQIRQVEVRAEDWWDVEQDPDQSIRSEGPRSTKPDREKEDHGI
ncbi:hypothetical protein BH23PLA1_BH23PLA1_33030 [soil metagenome]